MKNMKLTMFKVSVIVIMCFGLSCKLPSITQQQEGTQVPGTYEVKQTDTLQVSSIFKQFYTSNNLLNLIDTVIARNPDRSIAMQRIEWMNSQFVKDRAALSPSVQAMLQPSVKRFGLYTMDGAGNIVTEMEPGKLIPRNLPDYNIALQSSWEADLWGKLKNRKKASYTRYLASQAGVQLVNTSLVAQTAASFYELMGIDEMIKYLDATIELQTQVIDVVETQKAATMVTELAVQQFKAQLVALQAMRIELKQKGFEIETRINDLAGRPYQPILRDTNFFDPSITSKLHLGIPSQLITRRPDIRMAEQEWIAAGFDLTAARAAFFPSLTVNAALGLQAYRTGLWIQSPESLAFSVVASLTQPIWNRGALRAQFKMMDVNRNQAFISLKQVVNKAYNEVNNEWFQQLKLKELVDLKRQQNTYTTNAVTVSKDLFRTGRATYLEVLISQQQSMQVRMELIEARKKQLNSMVMLYRALGGGIE